MHSYILEVTLYVADNVTENIYASASLPVTGVGTNQTKAYMGAIKTMNHKRPEVQGLMSDAREKIVEYYNSKCDFILKDAESLAGRKEFDAAIYTLISIPEICKDCYMSAQDITIKIFKQKMENECMQNIAKAKTAKAQNDFDLAASYLTTMLPDVSCYSEAQALLKEIEDHRCSIALGKAQGAWSSGDYRSAGRWLGEVAADSKCYRVDQEPGDSGDLC